MACSDVPRAVPCPDIWVGSSLGILKGETQLDLIRYIRSYCRNICERWKVYKLLAHRYGRERHNASNGDTGYVLGE